MEKYLEPFKRKMKISHSYEDEDLLDMIHTAYDTIKGLIGTFDIDTYSKGRSLVYNHFRYDYNGQVEFFEDNFREKIMNASLELMKGEENE